MYYNLFLSSILFRAAKTSKCPTASSKITVFYVYYMSFHILNLYYILSINYTNDIDYYSSSISITNGSIRSSCSDK